MKDAVCWFFQVVGDCFKDSGHQRIPLVVFFTEIKFRTKPAVHSYPVE